MGAVSAKEAQTRFGQLLDRAQKEDVSITRHDRGIAVIVSTERYEEMRRAEDAYWLDRAEKAAQGGFLSPEESVEFLREKIDAASVNQ